MQIDKKNSIKQKMIIKEMYQNNKKYISNI